MTLSANLVAQKSTSIGTGDLNLQAITGYRTFLIAFPDNEESEPFYYFIRHRSADEWEVGTGYLSAGVLVRDTVLESSNGGALVDFSAGTKDIINDIPSSIQEGRAPLASPTFTGNPTAPTPTESDNDTSIATTAFVNNAVKKKLESFILAGSDADTALTTGANKAYLPAPYGFKILAVKGNLKNPATGATLLTVDINKNGVSILSTKLTFDAGETTTLTATDPAVISSDTLAADDQVTIDIDNVGNTFAGTGLVITLIGYQT